VHAGRGAVVAGEIRGIAAVLNPNATICRFDVFAEYTRQQAIEEGMPPDMAKGYGLWLAKVVAARRFGHAQRSQPIEQKPARGAPRAGRRSFT
jgi:hypothetical protein